MRTDQATARGGQATVSEDRRRWLALYVLCLGMLMIVLDATMGTAGVWRPGRES
jgi:hypothetical protein